MLLSFAIARVVFCLTLNICRTQLQVAIVPSMPLLQHTLLSYYFRVCGGHTDAVVIVVVCCLTDHMYLTALEWKTGGRPGVFGAATETFVEQP